MIHTVRKASRLYLTHQSHLPPAPHQCHLGLLSSWVRELYSELCRTKPTARVAQRRPLLRIETNSKDQCYGFSGSHAQMWESGHKEGWVMKNGGFQTVVLEKTIESPLNLKESKPVNLKGNQPYIFIGRTDAEAEALILWPPNEKLTHCKSPWCWERLKAKGRRGRQKIRWLDGITDSMDMNLSKVWEMVKDREAWHAAAHRITKSWAQLIDWTTTTIKK